MAREIQLGQFGNHAMENAERLLRAIVLAADDRVKKDSPVDLGRFRGSWAIGENNASFPGLPPGDYRGQEFPPRPIGYTLGQERLGNVYSIHNNLPYAEKLANAAPGSGSQIIERKTLGITRKVATWEIGGRGSSIQTNGPGWIEAIVNDLRTRTRIAAERINRES